MQHKQLSYLRDLALVVVCSEVPLDPDENDAKSLLRLEKELSRLHGFPHIRQVIIGVGTDRECDAYFESMAVVETISDACKHFRGRLGAGLIVELSRDWPSDLGNFDYLEAYDISWMWVKPNQSHRQRVQDGLATADEKIRVLIADGVDPASEHSLLEELRSAASFLPQLKDDILDMDVWEPWTGISESNWSWIKENWGEEDYGN